MFMNCVLLVYSFSEVHFLFCFLFFLFFFFLFPFPPKYASWFKLCFCFLFFCFFLKIFICLLCIYNASSHCTYNASLHCKYTKVVNIIHICTKNGKYCTNFVNVYKICQFFLCLQYKFTL